MASMQRPMEELKKEAFEALERVRTTKELEAFRVDFLGRNGRVPLILRSVAAMPPAERKTAGTEGNALRISLEEAYTTKKETFLKVSNAVPSHGIDVSRPGAKVRRGHTHVLSQVLADAKQALTSLGFTVAEGPEVESEWYNFDALNVPQDHPARDMQDTFWLRQEFPIPNSQFPNKHGKDIERPMTSSVVDRPSSSLLLRTHTSPVQVRWMEARTPPFRICCPGRCFRRDATDATHDYQFHQMEMLYVDKNVSVAHLKFVVREFLTLFFKKETEVRLRPAYFPFVEPGFEFDMTCIRCGGKGCTLCKTGWIELGGAGMVNQKVFESVGYARGEWTGMAFGFGLDRLAMLKYRIPDIRLLFGGDLRFIEQF